MWLCWPAVHNFVPGFRVSKWKTFPSIFEFIYISGTLFLLFLLLLFTLWNEGNKSKEKRGKKKARKTIIRYLQRWWCQGALLSVANRETVFSSFISNLPFGRGKINFLGEKNKIKSHFTPSSVYWWELNLKKGGKRKKKKGNKTRADKVDYNENGYSFSHLGPFYTLADGLPYNSTPPPPHSGGGSLLLLLLILLRHLLSPKTLWKTGLSDRTVSLVSFPFFSWRKKRPTRRRRIYIFSFQRKRGEPFRSRRSWPPEGMSSEREDSTHTTTEPFFKIK